MDERQIKLLSKLLDGFNGKLTTSKWTSIAKYTALRNINELLEHGVLMQSVESGRSTSYEIRLTPSDIDSAFGSIEQGLHEAIAHAKGNP
jgi:hypothetical protein